MPTQRNCLKEYLNTKDLAALINRSPAAVRNLVLRRRVPYRRVAGRLTFLRQEIEEWIDRSEGLKLEDLTE
jgi:hypothetical protein